MIMQKQPDGTYAQIGFIKTSTEDIEKIVDRNGDIYFTKGFTRQVVGYPVTLPDSIGKPLLDYKIYGNIFQETGTVTENKKLKDSNNSVIIDSGGNEIRINEIVIYNLPSPEAPVEVVGVGNKTDNGYEIPVLCRGKNLLSLLNGDYESNGISISVINNKIKISGTANELVIIDIPLEKHISSGTYTKSFAKTGNCFGIQTSVRAEITTTFALWSNSADIMTGNIDFTAVLFRVQLQPGLTVDCTLKPMIELGTTATEYEPYREPITNPIYLPEPLYKGDYITKDKSGCKVYRAWGVKMLDGTENFSKNNGSSSNYLYFTSQLNLKAKNGDIKCTHLLESSSVPIDNIGINNLNPYNVIYFNFGADIMKAQPSGNTVTGLKEYLASEYAKGTPVTVYYPLAEPTEKSIELPDIPTLDGTTIIETDTELPSSNIEVSYKSKKLS